MVIQSEKIKEREWVKALIHDLTVVLEKSNPTLKAVDGYQLPYSSEILDYRENQPYNQNFIKYETDILIYEVVGKDIWKPRIIVEAKIGKITTHDAITYSQKAQTHKTVHPYLRYGILIGNRKHHPLPGRLFRHGQHFDFMQSWMAYKQSEEEWSALINIIQSKINASRVLEEIIFNSRSRSRDKFTSLHKPLILQK